MPTQHLPAGDTSVSIGIYASVLQTLGLLDGLSQLVDICNEHIGQALAHAKLPKHAYPKRSVRSPRNA